MPRLIFALLVFNLLAGLAVCYEQARREWYAKRLEQFKRHLRKDSRR